MIDIMLLGQHRLITANNEKHVTYTVINSDGSDRDNTYTIISYGKDPFVKEIQNNNSL